MFARMRLISVQIASYSARSSSVKGIGERIRDRFRDGPSPRLPWPWRRAGVLPMKTMGPVSVTTRGSDTNDRITHLDVRRTVETQGRAQNP
jgi:hypothetical protein